MTEVPWHLSCAGADCRPSTGPAWPRRSPSAEPARDRPLRGLLHAEVATGDGEDQVSRCRSPSEVLIDAAPRCDRRQSARGRGAGPEGAVASAADASRDETARWCRRPRLRRRSDRSAPPCRSRRAPPAAASPCSRYGRRDDDRGGHHQQDDERPDPEDPAPDPLADLPDATRPTCPAGVHERRTHRRRPGPGVAAGAPGTDASRPPAPVRAHTRSHEQQGDDGDDVGDLHASASRKTSDRRRRSKENSVTSARRHGRAQHVVAVDVELEDKADRATVEPPRPSRRAAAGPTAVAVAFDADHEPAARRRELVDGPGHDEAAVVDDRHLLAEVLDLVELVAREQDAAPGAGLFDQDLRRWRRCRSGRGPTAARRERGARGRGPARRPAAPAAGCRATASRPCRGRGRRSRAARAIVSRPPASAAARARAAGPGTRPARRRACPGRARAPRACSRSGGARPGRPACPFQRTVPASRSVRPKMARIVVVLPAPLGPRNPTTRPAARRTRGRREP